MTGLYARRFAARKVSIRCVQAYDARSACEVHAVMWQLMCRHPPAPGSQGPAPEPVDEMRVMWDRSAIVQAMRTTRPCRDDDRGVSV